MKVLIVPQNSELSSKISESSKQVAKGYYIWDDTGEVAAFPIFHNNTRKKTWIPEKTYFDISFSQLEREFPKNVAIVVPSASPFLGEAWYNEENDKPVLYKENWDSSD
jgi:hypothetical protein